MPDSIPPAIISFHFIGMPGMHFGSRAQLERGPMPPPPHILGRFLRLNPGRACGPGRYELGVRGCGPNAEAPLGKAFPIATVSRLSGDMA